MNPSRGLGYLVPIIYVAILLVVGSVLNWGFRVDMLTTRSWWPMHSVVLAGSILTFFIGRRLNRAPFEETIYEKTGPVTVQRPAHTLYFVRMEYWGVIILALYLAFYAFRGLKA